uniref:Uncharacterized protein n=1 Tax=Rhizophora mucronata TaxID=61149 RepID=A0A2P2QIE5_RHIMU
MNLKPKCICFSSEETIEKHLST